MIIYTVAYFNFFNRMWLTMPVCRGCGRRETRESVVEREQ